MAEVARAMQKTWNTKARLDQVMKLTRKGILFRCGCVGTSAWIEPGRLLIFPNVDCPRCDGFAQNVPVVHNGPMQPIPTEPEAWSQLN